MATFTGKDGKQWAVEIDAPKIFAVRSACDPKFMLNDDDEKENTPERLGRDGALLCRVIYVLCEAQRVTERVSEPDPGIHWQTAPPRLASPSARHCRL